MAAAALILTLAYTVYGITGFGAVIIAVPLLSHFMPLRFAVPLVLVYDLLTGVLLGLKGRHAMNRSEILRLLPFLIVGMAIGTFLLAHVADRWLLLVLGSFVLSYAIWSLLSRAAPSTLTPRWAAPAGLIGGTFTAMYGTGGPIYMIYLARRLADKAELRATIGVLILGTSFGRLLLFTGSGFYEQPGLLPLALTLLPCAVLGYLAGSQLHLRLPAAAVLRAVWALLVVAGASVLWRALTQS